MRRRPKREIGGRVRAGKAALDGLGDFFFALDSGEVIGVGFDLAFVLDGQALFRVIPYLDTDLPGFHGQPEKNANFDIAGQGVERYAEQGEPAPVVADDCNRLFTPAGGRDRLADRAEIDDGNATRNRYMFGQGDGAGGEAQQKGEDEAVDFHE